MLKCVLHPIKTIKNFFRTLYRLYYWLPVIWKDQWWDWYFLIAMIEHKLRYDIERYEKHGIHLYKDREIRQMRLAAALCKRLADNDYNLFFWHEFVSISDEPFDTELKGEWIGQFGGEDWYKHDDYMVKQDLDYLCQMLRKHMLEWWD